VPTEKKSPQIEQDIRTVPSGQSAMKSREKLMTFDQWSKEVSKTIPPQSDEIQKSLGNYSLLSDEDFEEEESSPSQLKK
jgi:hypothetical protein